MNHDAASGAGGGVIEKEHRVQVDLILALEQGLALGKSLDELRIILTQMVDFTDMHFMSEMVLMRLYAYPRLAEHEAAHDHLMEQARRIQDDFCSEELSGTSADLMLLKQWLLDHIRSEDYAFHLYLTKAASPT